MALLGKTAWKYAETRRWQSYRTAYLHTPAQLWLMTGQYEYGSPLPFSGPWLCLNLASRITESLIMTHLNLDMLAPFNLVGILVRSLFPFGFVLAVFLSLALYITKCLVYSYFFDPLRHFPGPRTARFTLFSYIARMLRGRIHIEVLALHEKYGPVVRLSPTHLSFIEPEAWKGIHGRRTDLACGLDEIPKDPAFYVFDGVESSIINESAETHATIRKMLSPGFSERAMREQEPIISGYVSLLIRRLHEYCMATPKNIGRNDVGYSDTEKSPARYAPLDMRAWYNWTTFDIIGDLALGEPFGCLQNVEYHPWVSAIVETIRYMNIIMTLNLLDITKYIMPILAKISPDVKEHQRLGDDRMKKRMALNVPRPDFMETLLQHKKNGDLDLTLEQIASTAGIVVLAGSETTATLLAGATYLLLRNPPILARATEEVRSRFSSPEDITLLSVNNLPYLHACLSESMRVYPPQPIGMPHLIPKGGAVIAGVFVPENTSVAIWQWAINHSSTNWHDPFTFKPERFLEGQNTWGDRLDAMQPFSVGPRNCIGKTLAYAEMRLIMAQILFHFDMELAESSFNWIDQHVTNLWNKEALNVYLKPVYVK